MEKYFKPKLFEKIIKEVGSIKERNSLHAWFYMQWKLVTEIYDSNGMKINMHGLLAMEKLYVGNNGFNSTTINSKLS